MREVSTRDLVTRAQAGDKEAFAMIFDRFHDEVYRFAARRLGDPVLAQDVAAETFVALFPGIRRFRWTGVPFEAWLYTIARRRIADELRGQARSARVGEACKQFETESAPAPSLEGAIDMRAALARMPWAEREILELRFMEDLDAAQTALRVGKTPGAVRVAQHRALARLREMMDEGENR
ncbi:MAG: sigma-70 family RNA polymerase sigma factor [Actinomycetota bacterium]